MNDTTNHAEVIRNWMDHEGGCAHYNTDIPERCNCGYTKALTALDALTRELEAHRSAQPIIRKQLIEQSARIATLERMLMRIVNCTDSEMGDGDGARAIALAALAHKEVQG